MAIYTKPIRVGAMRQGGIGDRMVLGAFCKAIKRNFPQAHVTAVTGRTDDVLRGNPSVDVVEVCHKPWPVAVKMFAGRFDLFYELRYVTRTVVNSNNGLVGYRQDTRRRLGQHRIHFDRFTGAGNDLDRLFGIHTFDLLLSTACLEGSQADFTVTQDHENLPHLPEPYVTVHNGADGGRQTKCYPTKNWAKVVSGLMSMGFPVVQLGVKNEEIIPGVMDITTRTSIEQTAAIIAGSRLHLDTEGGLVYIASAVGTKSLVLFGPTPLKFFGFDKNINLMAPECEPCWGGLDNWIVCCELTGKGYCEALSNFDPENVVEAARAYLQGKTEVGHLPHKKDNMTIVRSGGLGDCILLLPAIKELSRRGVNVRLEIDHQWVPVFEAVDYAEIVPLSKQDRQGRFIDLTYVFESNIRRFTMPRVAMAADMLDVELGDIEFDLPLPNKVVMKSRRFMNREANGKYTLAICPESSSFKKDWGKERFQKVHRLLYEKMDGDLVTFVIGNKGDDYFDGVDGVVNLNLSMSIQRVAGLLKHVDCLLTVDTGPMHVAAALGTPVVAVFGPTDPKLFVYGYDSVTVIKSDHICRPCHETACTSFDCFSKIVPELVADVVVGVMGACTHEYNEEITK